MKKIWVVLLAAMMALAVCLTASVADEATVNPLISILPFDIGDGNSYSFEIINNSSYDVKTGDTVVATLTHNNGVFALENQSDSLMVKTDKTILVLEKNATFAFDETNKVITLTGNVKLSTDGESDERIVIAGDGTLTLAGGEITASEGPGIKILPTVNNAIINLQAATTTTVKGSNNYAGVEVGWENSRIFASLIIEGNGELDATGGSNSAGIGGSYSNKRISDNELISSYYGNITIKSGNIKAKGLTGAGIGSGLNNRNNEDGSDNVSASYRMVKTYGLDREYASWGTITIEGGSITAIGTGGGAGIGGGNHVDSGQINIKGGSIYAKGDGGGAGIGTGIGSEKQESDHSKGPGNYFARINITGGTINASSGWLGAGIGGGYASDAFISISNARINAAGGNGNSGSNYHGGAGIGGGHQGLTQLTINSGIIEAHGGTGAPGVGYGPSSIEGEGNKDRGKDSTIKYSDAFIHINGGTIKAYGGMNGAGIGSGNGDQFCDIDITNGNIEAYGYSDEAMMLSGAGIGSGSGLEGGATKYKSDTDLSISISGGSILAVGGWGAAGIGSGAKNKTANTINISGGKIEAYADGTKFAIDTRSLNADGSTSSITAGRNITRDIVQGTFVHNYEDGGISQSPEGLKSIFVAKENENPDSGVELTRMPEGYRSFATSVDGAGTYMVYTDSASIGEGGGRYFAEAAREEYNKNELGDDILFESNNGKLSDNFYLYPVKTIVVSKEVAAEEGADRSGINGEFSFALWSQAENGYVGGRKTISIVNGVSQNKAYFVNIPDGQYDITEMNGDTPMREGSMFSGLELRRIRTRHGAGTDNDGVLSPDQWSDAVTVINTFAPPRMSLSGVKTWNDADNQDGIRPAFIMVNLLADGAVFRTTRVTPDASGAWRYSFENLPGRSGGNSITYTVSEEPVPGYTAEVSGMNLINTHIPEIVSITGVKTWNDADNQDGIRPAFITVNLLADGAVVRTTRVTPDASGAWRYSFENLPGRGGGNPITYTVSEEPVAGYTAEVSGTNLINTHIPETIDITGVKIWNDADNQDGIRPANIRVNLLANGTQTRTATVTGTTNRWNFTFEDLPRFEGGVEIAYTVTEAPVAGYTTAINGTTITNTHVPEVVTISGTKTWNDNNNEDGLRPDSITVNLLADGRKIDRRTVLGGGSYAFENLNRYERGREIRYSIEEEPVAGYTAEVSGYNLINTHVPERVEISGTKTWADHDNRDGLRPQSVTVNLMADGTQAASQTVTGEGNVWSYSFTNLPGYRNGRRIVYTVTENPVAEYETSIIGTNIYNIHQSQDAEPERYTVTIRYWADGAKAFPDYNGTYNFGEEYDVTSPAKPGYTVDKALVAGIVYENTVIDVYYTPNTVKLSVFYQYLDGSTAADPHFETLHAGDRYSVISPVLEGYTASIAVVEGTMPGQDLQVIVWYRPDTAEENEGRVPLGDGTTMITEYGVPLGLGDTNRNAGECYD